MGINKMKYRDILGLPKKQPKKKIIPEQPKPSVSDLLKEEFGDTINEGENASLWTWVYKGLLAGFKKAGKKGGNRIDDVAQAAAFLIKTEFGVGAKNDFIKTFKKWL